MALLYIDSFDHYNAAHLLDKWTSNFTASGIAIGRGRCGSNCLEMGTFNQLVKGIDFGSTTATVGFAFQVDSTQTLALSTITLLYLGASSTDHVYLQRTADGSLKVYSYEGTVLLGSTAPDVIRQDVWYFIEWQVTVHPSAGAFSLRVDNVEVLAVSGVDTQHSGAPMELQRIHFACSSNQGYWVDDLYVLDSTGPAPQNTFLGDVHIEYLRPVSAGTHQDWNVVGPSHWQAIDDAAIPDDDATYLSTTTLNAIDTQHYMGTGLPAGTIFGLQINLHARKTDAGIRTVAPVIRHAGTDYVGDDQAPGGTNYHYLIQTYATNPGTGAAWTIADVNAAEYGVKMTE